MRAALPEDIPVREARMVEDRHPAPMAQVKMSDYRVTLEGEGTRAVLEQVPAFLSMDEVLTMKKTKSGEKQINARPLVVSIDPVEGGFETRMMLTEQQSLKPELLVGLLAKLAGVDAPEARVHRLTLLGEDGDDAIRPRMEL